MTSHFFSGIRITNLGQGKAIIEKMPIFLNQHDTHVFFYKMGGSGTVMRREFFFLL